MEIRVCFNLGTVHVWMDEDVDRLWTRETREAAFGRETCDVILECGNEGLESGARGGGSERRERGGGDER